MMYTFITLITIATVIFGLLVIAIMCLAVALGHWIDD